MNTKNKLADIFCTLPKQLLQLFSASPEMLVLGIPALRIISISFVFAAVTILCGYFVSGLGNDMVDMSASVENLLLEADALGLGAVWLGIAPLKERMEAVRTVLNVPENLDAFAIIPCGYPEAVHTQQDRFDKKRIHYVL